MGDFLAGILTFIIVIVGWSIFVLSNSKVKPTKAKRKTNYHKIKAKKTTSKLPGVHEDYDEKLRKQLIKEGKYDSRNFEEEELEEDDYHYEDDK